MGVAKVGHQGTKTMIPTLSPGLEPLFRRLSLRDGVSEEERHALSEVLKEVRSLPAGTDIVSEGDRPGHSTLVISGLSCRYRGLESGKRQITAIHVPGDFVDLHSFLIKQMDHSVGTLSPCVVVYAPHEGLERITERYPHLARMLWLLTLIDASIHRQWLVTMGAYPALNRTAHLLCELFMRLTYDSAAVGQVLSLPITQTDLGDTLGLSTVHTNRVIQELRSRGLIQWQGQEIRMLNWDGLAALAQFDPLYLHLGRERR
jgi:CRP-like cAMP-binding protein